MSHLRRILIICIVLAAALTASTAYACGCGMYVPSDGDAEVSQERALIRWDGSTEDIVMSLGVLGSSSEAAVIMPVPSRADVQLGDATLFDELDELTKPLVVEQRKLVFNLSLGAGAMPETGAGPGAVQVLSRQTLGPFDVVNIQTTEAGALRDWLDENGFVFEPQVADVMQPYIDMGWTFVAVRLVPGQADRLSGDLDPLWMTFESAELVYPMRPSVMAASEQTVSLYVLAEHRVDKSAEFGASRVPYANWIDPDTLPGDSALVPFVDRQWFLTKFIDTIDPALVDDDFFFSYAASDETEHETRIVTRSQDASLYVLIGMLILGFTGVVALVTFAVLVRMGRRAAALPQ
jgi:hypothetical protein